MTAWQWVGVIPIGLVFLAVLLWMISEIILSADKIARWIYNARYTLIWWGGIALFFGFFQLAAGEWTPW